MYGFDFNGTYSKALRVFLVERPPIPKARKILEYQKIPARGTVSYDTGAYEDITITFKCAIIGKDVIDQTMILNNWLDGDGILRLDYLEGFFFKVKDTLFDGTKIDCVTGEFEVSFVCDPFKYYDVGTNVITITEKTDIISPEFFYESEPILKVYGNDSGLLVINGEIITIKDIDEYIYIDSYLKDAYKDTHENLNKNITGFFPIFDQHKNEVVFGGDITRIDVIPNWRCK